MFRLRWLLLELRIILIISVRDLPSTWVYMISVSHSINQVYAYMYENWAQWDDASKLFTNSLNWMIVRNLSRRNHFWYAPCTWKQKYRWSEYNSLSRSQNQRLNSLSLAGLWLYCYEFMNKFVWLWSKLLLWHIWAIEDLLYYSKYFEWHIKMHPILMHHEFNDNPVSFRISQ